MLEFTSRAGDIIAEYVILAEKELEETRDLVGYYNLRAEKLELLEGVVSTVSEARND